MKNEQLDHQIVNQQVEVQNLQKLVQTALTDSREKESQIQELFDKNKRLLDINFDMEQNLRKCTPRSSKTMKVIDFNQDMTKEILSIDQETIQQLEASNELFQA